MKKIIIYTSLLLMLGGCNDSFMERYPLSELAPENSFASETELRAYTNGFYAQFPGAVEIFYNGPLYADDDARTSTAAEIRGARIIPTTGGGWDWGTLRKINFFLENSHKFDNEPVRRKYDALARFFRAYFYYDKVQRFGDVPWYEKVLEMDDDELYKARDSRSYVFEKMLADIDYAIEYLDAQRSPQLVTKWTALALKSRMCLFEGTFRKYHGLGNWQGILEQSVSASLELMKNGGYQIYTSTPDRVYQELFTMQDADPSEMILARQYSMAIPFTHNTNFYTLSVSFGRPGVVRQVIQSYLNADGTRFTDQPNYVAKEWYEEFQNRDPRLAQTVRGPGYKRIGESHETLPDFAASITGYQYVKYIQAPQFDSGNCTNDMPIFRYAEVLLNYAEAKAEMGTLNQSDVNISIKHLRDRVGMPNLNLANANASPDPFLADQYKRVSGTFKGVILEIRRERRVELIREGLRYHDLMRWKEGHLLSSRFYGVYFPGIGEYDLNKDGNVDLHIYQGTRPPVVADRQYLSLGEIALENGNSGQIMVNPGISKSWNEERDYLYPIPIQERILNKKLTQNKGWNDGIEEE